MDNHEPEIDEGKFIAENAYRVTDRFTYDVKKHAYQRTDDYLFAQIIPYIGSKRKLLPLIRKAIQLTDVSPQNGTLCDIFAGSGVVSRLSKLMGFRTISNDWEPYAEVINRAFVELNRPPIKDGIFETLNNLAPLYGYLTANYCPKDDSSPDPTSERCYYTRANGMKFDAIREKIAEWESSGEINSAQRNYLLTPLLSSASFLANTSGVFKAFHAGWGGATKTAHYRILSEVKLSAPPLYDNGKANIVTRLDASTLISEWNNLELGQCDIVYLDPPYNQHPYGSNYHMLNTIALWDKPEVASFEKAKSGIRNDWRTERRSSYNSRAHALKALTDLLDNLPARFALISYSTDGNIPLESLVNAIGERGYVRCLAQTYKRYRVSHQRYSHRPRNTEFVLVLDRFVNGSPISAEQCLDMILSMGTGRK